MPFISGGVSTLKKRKERGAEIGLFIACIEMEEAPPSLSCLGRISAEEEEEEEETALYLPHNNGVGGI